MLMYACTRTKRETISGNNDQALSNMQLCPSLTVYTRVLGIINRTPKKKKKNIPLNIVTCEMKILMIYAFIVCLIRIMN